MVLKKDDLRILEKIQPIMDELEDEEIWEDDDVILEVRSQNQLIEKASGHINIYLSGKKRILAEKMYSNSDLLSKVAEVRTGIMGFQYWPMAKIIDDNYELGDCVLKILPPSLIDRYQNLWGFETVDLYKQKFHAPRIRYDPKLIDLNTWEIFLKPKIIVRGVARRVAAAHEEEPCGMLVAVHCVIPKRYNFYYLLALLNSSLFNWLHIMKYYSARIPQGSLRYPVSFFKTLPIRKVNLNTSPVYANSFKEIMKHYDAGEYHRCISKVKSLELTEGDIRILYDCLCVLGKQISELLKQRNLEMKKFFDWLLHTQGIDKTDFGKKFIADYYGGNVDEFFKQLRTAKGRDRKYRSASLLFGPMLYNLPVP